MAYTNIYPVFVKFKKYKHVIFNKEDSSHLSADDYASLNYADLNEKIKNDILCLIGATNREEDKYILINENNRTMLTTETKPEGDCYYVRIDYEEYIYIFLYAYGDYILINYAYENNNIEYVDDMPYMLPTLKDSQKYIHKCNKPYAKYLVNTYSSYYDFFTNQLGVVAYKIDARYNADFQDYILKKIDELELKDSDFSAIVRYREDNQMKYMNIIRFNGILIVKDWYYFTADFAKSDCVTYFD